jgi:hypothetical protein
LLGIEHWRIGEGFHVSITMPGNEPNASPIHLRSKANHACAVALHSMYYNFVRLHKTLKVSPAMAAGVTDRLWEMVGIVDVVDAFEAKRKREPKVILDVQPWRIGNGYYVTATMPGSEPKRITETFATEGEAWRWIKNDPLYGCTKKKGDFRVRR